MAKIGWRIAKSHRLASMAELTWRLWRWRLAWRRNRWRAAGVAYTWPGGNGVNPASGEIGVCSGWRNSRNVLASLWLKCH
jgi:hypothetical protein